MYVPSQIEFATNIKSILFTQQVDTVLNNKILAFVSLQIDDHNFISLDGTRYITVYMYTSTAAIFPGCLSCKMAGISDKFPLLLPCDKSFKTYEGYIRAKVSFS